MKKVIIYSLFALFLCACNNAGNKVADGEMSAVVLDTAASNASSCIWKTGIYVNEFDEPTGEKYAYSETNGVFSNSATTNSDLRVRILVDKKSVRINLFEYGANHPVKGRGFFRFKAKGNDDRIIEFRTYNTESGDNFVEDEDVEKVRELLTNGAEIKFVGTNSDYGSLSEYKFTLSATSTLKDIVDSL